MPAVVCLFRGVNLGSQRRVSMEKLRAMFESLGLRDARTYVQSGNVVFQPDVRDMARLSKRIAQGFEDAFGFRSDVVLRTAEEMRGVIVRNPFEGRGIEPAKLLVWFLDRAPLVDAERKIGAMPIAPEEVVLGVRELYIHFPDGQGRSKLPWGQLEKALGCTGTGRNWNTVVNLLKMADDLGEQATG